MPDKNEEHKGAHGGVRKGAGRKTRYEKTIVIRVPEQYKSAIKALIEHIDECEKVDRHYSPVVSKPIFTRSLQGKPQQVTFTVSPVKAT
ncbi:hypothetical protein [Shewanella psychromarinicola]|uniref:Uncharacterized protein n=1 Tax=Shewanella psychromarinicola TaxID=2487742 RepID=A0A3N4DV68_9GAMM|nr:hypothetical protein [Shewanella psychromarinicola]AZG34593.1 hypothetical protein EGC80_06420 [Shewanella psychromarinicola]MCL1084378.1 hypothetical protein [Shewanella psychromarinicola]RPA28168.1 hypothetical protein EGC77_15750 [Shewanella psychromarinicola]